MNYVSGHYGDVFHRRRIQCKMKERYAFRSKKKYRQKNERNENHFRRLFDNKKKNRIKNLSGTCSIEQNGIFHSNYKATVY